MRDTLAARHSLERPREGRAWDGRAFPFAEGAIEP